MRRVRRIAPTLALLLAACGQQQQQEEGAGPATVAPTGTPEAAAPDAGKGMTLDRDMAGGRIPDRFQGEWDAEAGTCDASSEMRVRITARRLEYYESIGDVSRISAAGDDVIAELAMTGEGMIWTDQIRLQLTAIQGREALLVLPGPDSDIVLRPVPRFRCPA